MTQFWFIRGSDFRNFFDPEIWNKLSQFWNSVPIDLSVFKLETFFQPLRQTCNSIDVLKSHIIVKEIYHHEKQKNESFFYSQLNIEKIDKNF